MVCRRRRCGVEPFRVPEEPPQPSLRRYCREVDASDIGPTRREAAVVRGSFYGRRHADRSLCVDEDLSAKRRLDRTAGRRWRVQCGERFSRRDRSNKTGASTTDAKARLCRKGKGKGKAARLCFMGHALMDIRDGLVVEDCLTQANGHAEGVAAFAMLVARRPSACDRAGCRQGLRHQGLCRTALDECDTARGAEHERTLVDARRPQDAPRRICLQPADSQVDQRSLRLNQDDCPPG